MDLTAQAIEKLQESGEPQLFNINGVEFASNHLVPMKPFLPDPLKVSTLNAIIDLFGAGWEKIGTATEGRSNPVIHIESPTKVSVVNGISNNAGQRVDFICAELKFTTKFPFGEWMSQEALIIALQAQFLVTPERDKVLRVASKLASEDRLEIEDSGVHQTATAKSGVALVEKVEISPRILLVPYRTFREVKQPGSEFIFRIKKGGSGLPLLALFEADGGQWQLEAMNNIANYLTGLLPVITVVH